MTAGEAVVTAVVAVGDVVDAAVGLGGLPTAFANDVAVDFLEGEEEDEDLELLGLLAAASSASERPTMILGLRPTRRRFAAGSSVSVIDEASDELELERPGSPAFSSATSAAFRGARREASVSGEDGVAAAPPTDMPIEAARLGGKCFKVNARAAAVAAAEVLLVALEAADLGGRPRFLPVPVVVAVVVAAVVAVVAVVVVATGGGSTVVGPPLCTAIGSVAT